VTRTLTPPKPSPALAATDLAVARGVRPGGHTAPLSDPARAAARHARRHLDRRAEREALAQARPDPFTRPFLATEEPGGAMILEVEGHFTDDEATPRYPVVQVEPMVPAEVDLDPETFEKLADRSPEAAAIAADIWVKDQQGTAREAWIRTAKVVYVIFEKKLWQHHPGQFTSFGQWAKQSEIDLSGPVASDMHAITQFAPHVASECGMDLWDVIRECGPAKVRQLVPHMRDAYQEGTFGERIGELLETLPHTSFRGLLKAIGTQGVRKEPRVDRAVYEDNDDGTTTITLEGVDFDTLEALIKAIKVGAWFNPAGEQLLNPLDPNFDPEP
jgi:hypothetical protein